MKRREFVWLGAAAGLALRASLAESGQATQERRAMGMKIKLTSVFVRDQGEAAKFYTEVLGFVKKQDFPVGQYRWLTVVAPAEPNGTELLLEPNANLAAQTYQAALFKQGIAAAAFAVDDIRAEVARLKSRGVAFTMEPADVGTATIAMFDDTSGNLIQIYQPSDRQP